MTTERTEERLNRFNCESVMLTKEEAKIHDEIFIHEVNATLEKALGRIHTILGRYQMKEGNDE